jgi:histidinol-phosphate/aromatic aminotransferase/cobyric acid decarboxylase-like protein
MKPPAIPPAGPHGGDSWRLARSLGVTPGAIIDLSASMNPFAPDVSALVARIAADRPEILGRYPDHGDTTGAFAAAIGADPAQVVLTNGGAEAIALVAAIEGTGDVVAPEFSLYERHLRHVETGAPRWRSNPSNPLGRLAGPHEHARVWDEAFYAIATGRWTRGDRDSWRLGSLTKLWSCPGLRLGYVIAPDDAAAQQIRDRQPRWAVNALALAALPGLLDATDLPAWAAAISDLRNNFTERLRQHGFDVDTTDSNWVLIRRPGLRDALAPHLVLVRDCASFGLDGVARVALPHPDQLDQVTEIFARVGP